MTPAWEQAPEALGQLIDEINSREEFVLASVIIQPQRGIARDNDNGLVVAAFDRKGNPFMYAWYISPEGRIEADGY